jgi:competence protein ComEC
MGRGIIIATALLLSLLIFAATTILFFHFGEIAPAQNPADSVRIYFLNVSQGDSELILSGNRSALIDCGDAGQGGIAAEYILNFSGGALDYLVITHPDSDHMAGCPELLSRVFVKKALIDGQAKNATFYRNTMQMLAGTETSIAKIGETYALGNSTMKIIHANSGSAETNMNSIVVYFQGGGGGALFTGDCDSDCENSILPLVAHADLLKVAHHGSAYGTGSALLSAASPQYAIISVGKNNYGHPANETLERIAASGAEILRTDYNGTVLFEIENGTVRAYADR